MISASAVSIAERFQSQMTQLTQGRSVIHICSSNLKGMTEGSTFGKFWPLLMPELHVVVLQCADPLTSSCLALTCKRLWRLPNRKKPSWNEFACLISELGSVHLFEWARAELGLRFGLRSLALAARRGHTDFVMNYFLNNMKTIIESDQNCNELSRLVIEKQFFEAAAAIINSAAAGGQSALIAAIRRKFAPHSAAWTDEEIYGYASSSNLRELQKMMRRSIAHGEPLVVALRHSDLTTVKWIFERAETKLDLNDAGARSSGNGAPPLTCFGRRVDETLLAS